MLVFFVVFIGNYIVRFGITILINLDAGVDRNQSCVNLWQNKTRKYVTGGTGYDNQCELMWINDRSNSVESSVVISYLLHQ